MSKQRFFNRFLLVLILLSGIGLRSFGAADLYELKTLPIQEGGRYKPFDTFAKESLQLIYGKQSYKSPKSGETKSALEIIMTWILQPGAWTEVPLFEISYSELKKNLKLDVEKKHFSFKEVMESERLPILMQELQSRREAKEKLDPFFQAVQRLESQVFTFKEIASTNLIRISPPKEGDHWLAIHELPEESGKNFADLTKTFVAYLGKVADGANTQEVKVAVEEVNGATIKFKNSVKAFNEPAYPNESKIRAEVHLQDFHPFMWAWIFYFICAVFCFLAWIFSRHQFYPMAWFSVFLGMLLHLYGFALRVYITERAPVSNMYETVVWVGFGAVVFAVIIEWMYRWRFILLAGGLTGALCLVLADMAPVILDPSLVPLEPVLRNNFWLLVHVLTITISYAAFFLAFALGDIGLIYYILGPEKHQEKIKALGLAIYRSIQIGVALLGPGIILGGIWADYSWGRFWGWDPKETWALIALLGYLAVLHGRLGGWLKDFGMIVSAVLTFSLVIMAWYGVNFILGAGLHSYGFGAGGVEYVSGFVALHVCLVVFVFTLRKN